MVTVLGPEDRDSTVSLDVGDTVEVRVPENASTGYVWTLVDAPEGLELDEDGTTLPGQLRPGAAGEHWFRLVASGRPRGRVRLELRRPWEDDVAPSERYEVEVEPLT